MPPFVRLSPHTHASAAQRGARPEASARRRCRAALIAVVALIATTQVAAIDYPPLLPVPGSYDTSFGGAGTGKRYQFGITLEGPDYPRAIAQQIDGKSVVAGGCGPVAKFCAARLHADGSTDTTFTGDNFEAGKFTLNVGPPGFPSEATAIAVQPDGRLLLAGNCAPATGRFDACIARLLPDGRLDPSFTGPGGTARGAFSLPISGGQDAINTVLLQPDGKIIIAGLCSPQFATDLACGARLLPDGSLDTSFVGPNGDGAGSFMASLGGGNDAQISFRLQHDMKLLIASTCRGDPQEPTAARVCVTRLTTTGRLDDTFNSGGTPGQIRFISLGALWFSNGAIVQQADGKLVLLGTCWLVATEPERLCLARYTAAGLADPSFVGPNRTARGSFMLPIPGASGRASARGIALQPDGKIIASGMCRATVDSTASEICMARVHGDGTFDKSFDGPTGQAAGNGAFMLPAGLTAFEGPQLQLQGDGRIMHAFYCKPDGGGASPYRMCVSRVHGGPHVVPQCTLDIDGDGIAGTPTDTLILTRALLGFTSTAVRSGITLAPHATRSSWSEMLDFLTRVCDLPISPVNTEV